jgi:pimeloyl-ACP methyl ester carboxylesterase
MFTRKRVLLAALAAVVTAAANGGALAQSGSLAGYGIVLMHGKGGQPGGPIAGVAATLKAEGASVIMPTMPWSGMRGRPDKYDVTYQQALARIDALVTQLEKQGAKKIVVAGHSLGANAALGYAARYGNRVAAVIALAPGHVPERATRLAGPVGKAKELIAAGKGDVPIAFPDFNQGQQFEVQATPKAYVSFFDAEGPAVMPRNAAAMPAIPLLWVIGRGDPLALGGRGYAFDRAAKNPKSKYLEVSGGHLDTANQARQEIVAWLKSL